MRTRGFSRRARYALVVLLTFAACSATTQTTTQTAPQTAPQTTTLASTTPAASPPITTAASGIQPTAFGMHFLRFDTVPFPDNLRFGSLRVSDMYVRWTDLQHTRDVRLNDANPAVQKLDRIVAKVHEHGAEPLIVLAGTPIWAATDCPHGSWPIPTCGPKRTDMTSPWANYVRFLANRYSPAWFEIWNEPNLRNGFNDTVAKLAAMQKTAYAIIHGTNRANLVLSPSVAITAGHPARYLQQLFSLSGGKAFDRFAIHLYPSDTAAKTGIGPEWAIDYYWRVIRPVLNRFGIKGEVWDTEMNVGRAYMGITFTGNLGAAMVTRSYVLQLNNGITHVFWYAADDRHWTGTPLLKADLQTLTNGGRAFNFMQQLLVGSTPLGCGTSTSPTLVTHRCSFRLASGELARVVWTTKGATTVKLTAVDKRVYDSVGKQRVFSPGDTFRMTRLPTWVVR